MLELNIDHERGAPNMSPHPKIEKKRTKVSLSLGLFHSDPSVGRSTGSDVVPSPLLSDCLKLWDIVFP